MNLNTLYIHDSRDDQRDLRVGFLYQGVWHTIAMLWNWRKDSTCSDSVSMRYSSKFAEYQSQVTYGDKCFTTTVILQDIHFICITKTGLTRPGKISRSVKFKIWASARLSSITISQRLHIIC